MRHILLTFLITIFFIAKTQAQVVLEPIDAPPIPFKTLQGKWIIINYWASWCQPCVDEIKELNQFYDHYKNKVAVFAVNYDAFTPAKQLQLIKRYNIHYPSLKEDPAQILHLGDIRGVPVTYLFNPQGKLIKTLYGGQTLVSLKKAVHIH